MPVCLRPVAVALQDYLETKRIAFPRFYFVAPADLLDILSKGSNPQLILRHLPKNFDNVHNLTFHTDDNGEPMKVGSKAKRVRKLTSRVCPQSDTWYPHGGHPPLGAPCRQPWRKSLSDGMAQRTCAQGF